VSVADRVEDGLGPTLVRQGGPLASLKRQALCEPLEAVDELVSGEEGWALAFDPDASPWPAWTGQFVGATVPAGTLAQQRASIAARGTRRGTLGAVTEAIKATLTGSKRVTIFERTPDAYSLKIQVFGPQMANEAATRAAIRNALPVGLRFSWTLEILTGQTWAQLRDSGQTWDDLTDKTYEEVRSEVPE
jgi:hypothetical protein